VNFVYDLRKDFSDPSSTPVSTELLATSISSDGDPLIEQTQFTPTAKNPQLKFFDNHRGYVRCTLERGRLITEFRAVSTVRAPAATVSTTAKFVINDAQRIALRA
jgi:alkaline phosphatase D